MSAEKPEPGDVWELEGHGHVLSHEFVIEVDETHALCSERTGVSCRRRLDHFRHGRWCTNLFGLLSGDPSAWAAALRFAPEVFLLEVGPCERCGKPAEKPSQRFCGECFGKRGEQPVPGKPLLSLTRDGDRWCALLGPNLQEGQAGFGDTRFFAVEALAVALWERAGQAEAREPAGGAEAPVAEKFTCLDCTARSCRYYGLGGGICPSFNPKPNPEGGDPNGTLRVTNPGERVNVTSGAGSATPVPEKSCGTCLKLVPVNSAFGTCNGARIKRTEGTKCYAWLPRPAPPAAEVEGECPHRDCFFRCLLSAGNGLVGCACDRDRETEQDCVLRDRAANRARLERECAGRRADRVSLVKGFETQRERAEQAEARAREAEAVQIEARQAIEYLLMGECPEECPWWAEPCPADGQPCGHEGAGSAAGCRRRIVPAIEAVKELLEKSESMVSLEARALAAAGAVKGRFRLPDGVDREAAAAAIRFCAGETRSWRFLGDGGTLAEGVPEALAKVEVVADALERGTEGEGVFVTPDKLPALRRTANTAACLEGSDDETVEAIRQVHGIADELEWLAPAEDIPADMALAALKLWKDDLEDTSEGLSNESIRTRMGNAARRVREAEQAKSGSEPEEEREPCQKS